MMSNLGETSFKPKSNKRNAMRDFDQLPKELRNWMTTANLPWSPKSVRRVFDRAVSKTNSTRHALAELDRIQKNKIRNDLKKLWGNDYPEM